MLYLTDNPIQSGALLPAGADRKAITADEMNTFERRIWEIAGGGARAWRCDGIDVGCGRTAPGGASARPIVIIDNAPASQFAALVEALRGGAQLPDRLVCLALAGSKFRGQRDRSWVALRGNLHLTAYYRVNLSAARTEAALTMLPAVASAEAIRAVSQHRLEPRIKWVNDVMLSGRKVSGVLTATQVEGDAILHVVFGIGVNVAQSPQLGPSARTVSPGALVELDPELNGCLPDLFGAILARLDDGVDRLEPDRSDLYDRYKSLAGFVGREVRIWSDRSTAEPELLAAGRVTDLLPDLSLRVSGSAEPVRTGRMEIVD